MSTIAELSLSGEDEWEVPGVLEVRGILFVTSEEGMSRIYRAAALIGRPIVRQDSREYFLGGLSAEFWGPPAMGDSSDYGAVDVVDTRGWDKIHFGEGLRSLLHTALRDDNDDHGRALCDWEDVFDQLSELIEQLTDVTAEWRQLRAHLHQVFGSSQREAWIDDIWVFGTGGMDDVLAAEEDRVHN